MLRQIDKENMNYPQFHMETLSRKMLQDLAVTGMINIPDVNTKSPRIYPTSDLLTNHRSLGLVPVKISEPGKEFELDFTKKSVVGTSKEVELDTSKESEHGTSEGYDLESIGSHGNITYPADDNNSAPDRSKLVEGSDRSNMKKQEIVREMSANVTPNNKRWAKLAEVKNRVKNTFKIKKMIEFIAAVPKHNIATQTKTEIGGEEVIVNILPYGIVSGANSSYVGTYAIYTPENYGETFDYYDKINENRKDFFRAMYCIGDMLMADELDGDVEDWKQYVERSDIEVRAWKKKCHLSNAIFEKTGRVMEYDDTKYRRFVLKVRMLFRRFCPCQ